MPATNHTRCVYRFSGPFLLLLAGLLFCTEALTQTKKHLTPIGASKKIIKYGTASYYATKFNNHRTANGEIYKSKKYSAACNILPLNTWVRVTNISNNRSVVLKINDRLHPKNKRLIDLSWIAAKKLGYLSRGLVRVRVEVLRNFHASTLQR
ncbi:MAG: septal ring lytic transglycosylase RlpA family protein [Ginsengibacter sp.]